MASKMTRRYFLRTTTLVGAVALTGTAASGAAEAQAVDRTDGDPAGAGRTDADRAADRIVHGIRRPRIPQRDFPITRFGAVGDGATDNTAAIAATIQEAARRGGGRVVVPAGTWATGPIHLASRIELHVAEGATLLFSTDPAAFLPVVHSRWQGIEVMNYSPLIYARGACDVAVTGSGVLDGQASTANWWAWKKLGDADFPVFEAAVNAGLPVEQRDGTKYHFRPAFFEPYDCDRVLVEGVTFRNSPFWHLHPTLCRDVVVRGVTVNSTGPNTDGCDPDSCDRVLIDGASFDVGDDCVAIKSGRDADGRRVGVPCQNIVIQDCTFANGHGGVTIGSEMSGGVRDVYARDLTMTSAGLQSGHRLKTNSVRGGFIENSHVYRVSVTALGGPLLLVDYNYGEGDTGSFLPTVKDVFLDDWTVGSAAQGWNIQGYPEDPVGRIALTDITVSGTLTTPNVAKYVSDLELKNVVIDGTPQ